ncbi:HNH endonuclease signature motif containing protein [Chelativorans sp. Marseille-P2723]|uniref:HNH endonuclease n=1 Tax=Chelativorans sp. Marseille-P2723 TaxID=2709133 RepID=UPI0015709906|nr:HNH endonuclease signature motif containing protein [Chelativorans sp. Marseille-P2723]
MARTVKEWIGRTDDHRAPKSVRDRLLLKHPNCYLCSRKIVAGERMALDHVVALINGGENRERNLRPVHQKCHVAKTQEDVAEKAKVAAIRQKHHGIVDGPKMRGRPFSITKKTAERKAKASIKLPVPGPKSLFQEARHD